MATILLAWELGANLGHVARMSLLARQLAARGHTPVFAVRDLRSAEEYFGPDSGPVMQAPLRIKAGRNMVAVQLSYASLLNNIGFDDVLGLAARIRAWREMLTRVQAASIVCDHAPTAMVAARSLSLPCTLIGTGFTVPPLQVPFPLFQPELLVAPDLLLENEAAVLRNLNSALQRLGLPGLARLQDIFAGVESHVLSYPETDHYALPRRENYLGLPDAAAGLEPQWPAGSGPKLFAYLQAGPNLEALMAALHQCNARVLVRLGDAPVENLRRFLRPGLAITTALVNMRQAAERCDAYLTYAAHGLVLEMLLAGKPGLLLPDTVERALVARRLEALGAALVQPATGSFDLSAALEQLTENPTLRSAAEAFAGRHASEDRSQIPVLLAAAICRQLEMASCK